MKFIEDGPDIPDDLIDAVGAGEVVFVCGAGVSKRAGLPLFEELVEQVYQALDEDRSHWPAENKAFKERAFDRLLRSLEKRMRVPGIPTSRVRKTVADKLKPTNASLKQHSDLIHISRDRHGRPRLITTNFDTLFERAWRDVYQEPLDSFAGASLPAPGGPRDYGVQHLHGRIADRDLHLEETDLVLTSADFGDAYLRSGWASRYVADRLRLHTLVLVGYQAEDAAMRLLLDVLDADRERFPDLKKVYAFDQQATNANASWKAKGIEPILYQGCGSADHERLYATLSQWARYCDDPMAYARPKLEAILSKAAGEATDFERQLVVSLLPRPGGGDRLAELNPPMSWLGVFQSAGLMRRDGSSIRADSWIAKRLDDPEAVAACVTNFQPDADSASLFEHALGRGGAKPPKVFEKAWRLIIKAAREAPMMRASRDWHSIESRLARGESGHDVQRGIAECLRPRLRLTKAWRLFLDDEDQGSVPLQRLNDVIRAELKSADWPTTSRVVEAWREDLAAEADEGLLDELTTELERAIREAEEAELIGADFDRTDDDVNSVSQHRLDEHGQGFYPIIRVMADVWERLAAKDPTAARRIAERWAGNSYRLPRRMALYTATHTNVFSGDAAAKLLSAVDDEDFYRSGARRETMKLMAERWNDFPEERRTEVEVRLMTGPPRTLYAPDVFTPEDWIVHQEHERFKQLSRIKHAGGALSPGTEEELAAIQSRHPAWEAGMGDRDDFLVWMSETYVGPRGDVSSLHDIGAEDLIKCAFALQKQHAFDQGELWRVLCQTDPDRAAAALRVHPKDGPQLAEAWRGFLWETDRKNAARAEETAELLLIAPDDLLGELGASVTAWLRDTQSILRDGLALRLWHRLAGMILGEGEAQHSLLSHDDVLTEALNSRAGHLAEILIDQLAESNPKAWRGLPNGLRDPFDRLVTAGGEAGLLARSVLASRLWFLYAVDSEWVAAQLFPRFQWSDHEAAALWSARCYERQFGSNVLFDALRQPFLALFEREDVEDEVKRHMTQRLVVAAISERRSGPRVDLKPSEVKRALRAGGAAARSAAASFLSRVLRDAPQDGRSTVWQDVVGPTFNEIWPPDVDLREPESSSHLADIPLYAGDRLSDAAAAVTPHLVPMSDLLHSLVHDDEHQDLISQFPRPILELLSATIGEKLDPHQRSELETLLAKLEAADESVTALPAFRRLRRLLQR